MRSDVGPPQPPAIDRRLQFARLQLVGMPLMMLVPLLAVFGLFGEVRERTERAGDGVRVRVGLPGPRPLVHEGEFVAENMNRERISPDEIFAEMHKVGLHSLSQVRWVILETDGRLSVIAREPRDRPQQRAAGSPPLGG